VALLTHGGCSADEPSPPYTADSYPASGRIGWVRCLSHDPRCPLNAADPDLHATLRAHRGDYGFDGPLWGFSSLATGGALLAGLAVRHRRTGRGRLAFLEFGGSLAVLATVACYLHATRRGKFAVWADLLAALPLRGDEQVLDMGCGRGAVLAMVAKRLPRGKAVGLDLWTADQSGNRPEATRQNLVAEGAAERCELVTADMRYLPFPDATFDLVLSSLAIHNIDGSGPRAHTERLRAIEEAVRVLRPGGRLLIADVRWTLRYARRLLELGMQDVQQRSLGWRVWYGPGNGAALVSASKH